MNRIVLFFVFIIFIVDVAFAQNPLVKQWDKRFGGIGFEWLTCFAQTTDGGYILGGYSASGISGDKTQAFWDTCINCTKGDYWIVKTDAAGNLQWEKSYGGQRYDLLHAVQQTADGGYILGGYSASGVSGDKTKPLKGGVDYWIVKVDSLGNKQWDNDFGGTSSDVLVDVKQTPDHGYILGGSSLSGVGGDKTVPSWGTQDFWIVKTDSLGAKQWDKDFGAAYADFFSLLIPTSDGGYILAGYSTSMISGDKTQNSWGGRDYWIIKTDSLFNKIWDKDFGGTDDDNLSSIRQTADGGFILGGCSTSGSGGDKTQWLKGGNSDYDFWIIKTDSAGNKIFDKDFGGSNYEDEIGNVFQTADGGYMIAGTSYSNMGFDKSENNLGGEQTWIVKTDSLGIKQWDKTLFTSGHDEIGFAVQTNENCFTFATATSGGIAGYKTEPNWDTTNVVPDYWFIKFCDSTATTNINGFQVSGFGFQVYPNPAKESIVISSEFPMNTGQVGEKNKAQLSITDLLGNEILRQQLETRNFKLETSFLSPGIYFIRILTQDGVAVRKFVKE
ncbi:MAG: T9SS type A sorting domain-containing protein [Bacteroidia bacterium]